MQKKNNSSVRRGFKVWPRGKRYDITFKIPQASLPTGMLLNNFMSFTNYICQPVRLRRVVVRALSYGYLSSNSIEAFRKVMAPHFRKSTAKHKFLLRCYSYMVITKKPSEVRMGGGKGSKIRGLFSPVRPGQILFEVYAREPISTKKLFRFASLKLRIRTEVEII
jgi:ribosomal protein L16/L10AE